MGAATPLSAERPVVVRVQGLSKRYGSRPAMSGVDLEVRQGEIYGIIGPNGAGKTSLLHAVAGVLTFDAGRVDAFGVSLDSDRAAERIKRRIGLMPQGLGLHLYPDLSVEENIDFFAGVRLVPARDLSGRKRRLLEVTRLSRFRDRPARQLSGGMRQKLGLVCTLIHQPELVILDEPTTGVDPVSRRDFWLLLAELLAGQRTTALVSTAYMEEATRFDRVSLMFDGHMVATLTGAELQRTGIPLEDTFAAILHQLKLVDAAPPIVAPATSYRPKSEDLAIEAVDLTRTFGSFTAVDGVTFRVRAGEIFGMVGPNGAGKSTVIKMLTGLVPPTRGTARVAGVDVRLARQAARRRIGYMSQVFSLYRDLTVVENIRLYAAIYGVDARATRERTGWIIQMAGLSGREMSMTGQLPVGLRQRLALGCALVHRPEILFLDEPTSGVDPIGRRRFWETLTRVAREDGVAVLVTTHHLTEVWQCDRVGLMYQGRLVADAAPTELCRQEERERAPALTAAPLSIEDAFVQRILALEQSGDVRARSAA